MSMTPEFGETKNEYITRRAPERQAEHPEEDNQRSMMVAADEFDDFIQNGPKESADK